MKKLLLVLTLCLSQLLAESYTIKEGDTLSSIALEHFGGPIYGAQGSLHRLLAANAQFKSGDGVRDIYVGEAVLVEGSHVLKAPENSGTPVVKSDAEEAAKAADQAPASNLSTKTNVAISKAPVKGPGVQANARTESKAHAANDSDTSKSTFSPATPVPIPVVGEPAIAQTEPLALAPGLAATSGSKVSRTVTSHNVESPFEAAPAPRSTKTEMPKGVKVAQAEKASATPVASDAIKEKVTEKNQNKDSWFPYSLVTLAPSVTLFTGNRNTSFAGSTAGGIEVAGTRTGEYFGLFGKIRADYLGGTQDFLDGTTSRSLKFNASIATLSIGGKWYLIPVQDQTFRPYISGALVGQLIYLKLPDSVTTLPRADLGYGFGFEGGAGVELALTKDRFASWTFFAELQVQQITSRIVNQSRFTVNGFRILGGIGW